MATGSHGKHQNLSSNSDSASVMKDDNWLADTETVRGTGLGAFLCEDGVLLRLSFGFGGTGWMGGRRRETVA